MCVGGVDPTHKIAPCMNEAFNVCIVYAIPCDGLVEECEEYTSEWKIEKGAEQ